MPGAPCAPAASRAKQKARKLVTAGRRKHPAFPARMVLTVSSALSLVNRAFLPPSPARCVSIVANLDASVGASGPHGFAVRKPKRPRQKRRLRPSHPARVRDDRETPLGRAGWLEVYCCFYRAAKQKIFDSRAGQPMQIARDK